MLLEMFTILMMKFHFNMPYNLLQYYFDLQCELFFRGKIDYNQFELLENEYLKRKPLFTICLN